MSSINPHFYSELEARGMVKQVTDPDLAKTMSSRSITLYIGFDPSADSLHVGSMLGLMTLKRFQDAGHKPIAIVGGATGMIGDPSFKSQERSLLDDSQIEKNLEGIRRQISKILDFTGSNSALLLNNADWTKNFTYIEFLRDIGKHFTINHMMGKESVRARLEDRDHGISYTEFSYMLLQAYDFYHLNKTYGCDLQVGGSDQWGNITAGIELTRRMRAHSDEKEAHLFGLTHPLLLKSDGTKFGKSEKGTVWLDPEKTSPYEFYQFFLQTPDSDVVALLKQLSFLSLTEIKDLESSLKNEPEKRLPQKALAQSLTRMIHSEDELLKIERASQALFGADIKTLDKASLLHAFSSAPKAEKPMSLLDGEGLLVLDLVVESGLCTSKGNARKDIESGGIYLNNERVSDVNARVTRSDLLAESTLVLRKGKKNYFLFLFQN